MLFSFHTPTILSAVSTSIETMLAQADAAMYRAKQSGRNRCVSWSSLPEQLAANRRRVLKAGHISLGDQGRAIDCTINSLSLDSAGISVSSSADVPWEFLLLIKEDGMEMRCQVVARNARHLEVAFAI